MGLPDGSKESKFILYLERMEGELTFEESLQPLFDCLDDEANAAVATAPLPGVVPSAPPPGIPAWDDVTLGVFDSGLYTKDVH